VISESTAEVHVKHILSCGPGRRPRQRYRPPGPVRGATAGPGSRGASGATCPRVASAPLGAPTGATRRGGYRAPGQEVQGT
jgi:hypothetical protein